MAQFVNKQKCRHINLTKKEFDMEWTKETLVNTCIGVSKKAVGKKIIKFYESFGFRNSNDLVGIAIIGYYGVSEKTNSIILIS